MLKAVLQFQDIVFVSGKQGMIKENIPVVIGEKKKETEGVFREIASLKHSPLFFAEENFSVKSYKLLNASIEISVADKNSTAKNYQLDLPGIYQTKNLLAVLEACSILKDLNFNINANAIKTGLAHTKKYQAYMADGKYYRLTQWLYWM